MTSEGEGGNGSVSVSGASGSVSGLDEGMGWSWVPYAAPMGVFLGLTSLEGWAVTAEGDADPVVYPWLYAGKVCATTLAAWFCRSAARDYRPAPTAGGLVLAGLLGVLAIVAWVGLDGWYPSLPGSGARSGFDPGTLEGGRRWLFLAARLYGLVLLAPWIEELFWRGFVNRFAQDAEDFRRVPTGRVTWFSAFASSALFATAHPEWLPALLTGLGWSWLLRRTGRLSSCLASHVAANGALAVYVLATGSYKYW